MPLSALALVLVAALLHATWNVVAKRSGGGAHFAFLCAVGVSVLWAPLGVWALVQALSATAARPLDGWATAVLLASAVVHLVYFRCLLRGYRVSDLTVVYPVARGTGPLLTVLAAVLWLGERPGAFGAAGALAVSAGIVLLAGGADLWRRLRGGPQGDAAERVRQRARLRAGLGWGALTGALIAGYTVVDAYAVTVLLMSPILVDYFGNLLRVPFMLPEALRDVPGLRREARAQWRGVLVVAGLGPLAYVLVLYAVKLAPLSHVAPAREVSMLFAAWLGGRWLGEGDRGWRMAGAACMALGVGALALG